jgi:hypothetical protein
MTICPILWTKPRKISLKRGLRQQLIELADTVVWPWPKQGEKKGRFFR